MTWLHPPLPSQVAKIPWAVGTQLEPMSESVWPCITPMEQEYASTMHAFVKHHTLVLLPGSNGLDPSSTSSDQTRQVILHAPTLAYQSLRVCQKMTNASQSPPSAESVLQPMSKLQGDPLRDRDREPPPFRERRGRPLGRGHFRDFLFLDFRPPPLLFPLAPVPQAFRNLRASMPERPIFCSSPCHNRHSNDDTNPALPQGP